MSLSSTAAAQVNPWMRILGALEKKVNRHSYETWLKPTRFSHAVGKVMFIRVPTAEFRHIGDKYGDLIGEAVDNLGLEFDDFQFVTVDEDPSVVAQRPPSQPIPAQSTNQHAMSSAGVGAAPARSSGTAGGSQSRFDFDTAAQLNPKYTFDAFVIGSGNQFAHAAARAV